MNVGLYSFIKFYNDSISPVTKILLREEQGNVRFYNDSISPVTKIILQGDNIDDMFYNDSISPVTKMPNMRHTRPHTTKY